MGIWVYPHDNHDIEYINYDKLCIYHSISQHIPITSPTVKPNDSEVTCHLSRRPALRSRPEDGSILCQLGLGGLMLALLFGGSLKHPKKWNMYEHVIFCSPFYFWKIWKILTFLSLSGLL